MGIVRQLESGVPILVLIVALVGIVQSQNGMPNTTLNPFPSSTDVPTPSSSGLLTPSDTPGYSAVPSDLTCCYIQSQCNNCTDFYNVNSIRYCCPNCLGMVLVTDLVCRCTVPKGTDLSNLKCTLSDNIVGNYLALRPSYYDSGSKVLTSSFLSLIAGLLALAVAVL